MTEDLENLRKKYRSIEAPPYMAERIRANVSGQPVRSATWVPVTAGVVAALGAVSITLMLQQQAAQVSTPIKPSMTSLARVMANKPKVAAPSMSQLRTVKTPALPPKPVLKPKNRPQTYFQIEEENPKETEHA